MVAISISLSKENYDRLRSVMEQESKKMSEVVNWLFRLGYVRREELMAQEQERIAQQYRKKISEQQAKIDELVRIHAERDTIEEAALLKTYGV